MWYATPVKDLTIDHAEQAHKDGVDFVCAGGRLQSLSVAPELVLLNLLRRKEG